MQLSFKPNENTDWAKLILRGFLILLVLNIIMFIGLFGWVAIAILTIFFLVISNVATILLLLRSMRMMTAMEDAIQYVIDDITEMGDEFDRGMKEIVWMEDVPQARKASTLLYNAKFALLNAPSTLQRILNESIGNTMGPRFLSDMWGENDSDADIEEDDEFVNNLMRELEARNALDTNKNEPSPFAKQIK
jgi:hypothetical protein